MLPGTHTHYARQGLEMCFSSYLEIVIDFVGPEGGEGTEKARFSDDF